MSVYGRVPSSVIADLYRMNDELLRRKWEMEGTKRGYTDPGPIDLIEVNGVWMTPEDARRVSDAA